MTVRYNKISNVIIILLLTVEVVSISLLPMFVPIPSAFFQLLLYGTLLFTVLVFLRGVKIEWRMLLVVIAAGISVLMSDADLKYDAPARFMTWILLISAVGPLFYNSVLIRFRDRLFEVTLYVFMIIGTISFFYWLVGLPNLGRGHFTGITVHSMLLAPIASLGGIFAFYRFLYAGTWRLRYIYFSLLIFNGMDVFLAASRSAFVGFIFGLLILIFFNKFKYRKILLLAFTLFAIGGAVGMNDTDTDTYVSGNDNEGINKMTSRGLENTRENLWQDRIAEFKAHPIFGVGFASQDDKLTASESGTSKGNVEPGSTYLMILSMTGLVGAFTIILFLSKPLLSRRFWKRITSSENYKLASFAFFSIHFLGEGYLFASGSLMAFVFWTLVGATYPYIGINYTKGLKKK